MTKWYLFHECKFGTCFKKSNNVIDHINRLKKERKSYDHINRHRRYSIGQIPTLSHDKNTLQIKNRGELLQIDEDL